MKYIFNSIFIGARKSELEVECVAYPKPVELIPLRELGRDAVLVIARLFVVVVETRCVVFLPTSWITIPRISSTTSPRITLVARARTEEEKGLDIILFYLFRF